MFDVFFEKLQNVVEAVTAADERRHNIAHLSQWINLQELINQAKAMCPTDAAIPSESLVRLQFSPKNPYSHRALSFTSKIQVQYKIQRRQLRSDHVDTHYANAQFKYLKERAVQMSANVQLVCCDDKAKVPIGEPGVAVSTGVRGKQTIAPVSTTLGALDHNMTKASLTPSVILKVAIPDSADSCFVRGQVTISVNDSVYQPASPFRHAATLCHVLSPAVPILFKFTDGGTDQRNTLEAVKCASICIFKELDLDMLVLCRCAPGQSWINPAERVMSILNIGLQNCSLERSACDEQSEKDFKKASSMSQLRAQARTSSKVAGISWPCSADTL